jgi:hypothetical protein
MHNFTWIMAASSLGAVGFAESSFVFGFPVWASAIVVCVAAWAGVMVFQPAQKRAWVTPIINELRGQVLKKDRPAAKPDSNKDDGNAG